jgi:predicted 3-demethylubiquinone-9 3-methyltransferase (glyoxalase superfamily)
MLFMFFQKMVSDSNLDKSESVMKAMLQMKKMDIKALEQACEG